jgi:hypothetical protein
VAPADEVASQVAAAVFPREIETKRHNFFNRTKRSSTAVGNDATSAARRPTYVKKPQGQNGSIKSNLCV